VGAPSYLTIQKIGRGRHGKKHARGNIATIKKQNHINRHHAKANERNDVRERKNTITRRNRAARLGIVSSSMTQNPIHIHSIAV
jgi:predicted O-linked N-acetylglucosamine transferase (SPINDLY family)